MNQENNQQMNQPLVATLELPLYFLFFKLLYQPATKKAIMSRVISIACLRSDHEDLRRWCRHENVHCVPLLFLTLFFFFFWQLSSPSLPLHLLTALHALSWD